MAVRFPAAGDSFHLRYITFTQCSPQYQPTVPAMTFASISQLLQLINDSVASLQKICIDNELAFPSIDAPSFSKESEAFRLTPGIAEGTKIAASACLQLVAILLPPSHTLYQLVTGVSIQVLTYHSMGSNAEL